MNRRTPTRLAAATASLAVAVAIGSSARATPRAPLGQDRPQTQHVVHDLEHGHGAGAADPVGHDRTPGPAVPDPLAGTDLNVHRGEEAVRELIRSATLDEVAEDAGLAPAVLVEELRGDPSLFITDTGLLGYVDAFPLDGAETSSGSLIALPDGVDVGALSSMPSSTRTLYLDFDGHVTSGTAWADINAPEPIVSAAFTGSAAVQYEIWERVSEDFAPFAVNVTTIDPGVEAIRRSSSTDQVFGQRVVISPTNWVRPGVLGIALFGSFGSNGDNPAFAFTSGAPAKVIAEAVTHEAGHTFGLRHDGTCGATGAEYYDGHAPWAPIMGRSIAASTPVTQWSRGEYASANNTQDDVGLIRSRTGTASDDHGNSATTATSLVTGSSVTGVIGIGDVDVFSVEVPANGALTVSLRPTAPWGNLYATLTLRSPTGGVIRSALPTTPPSWTAAVAVELLAAGRYTIEVRPTGYLTPADGFSSYGSMGWYQVSVDPTAAPADPPIGAATATAQASRLGLRPTC